jgi:hypothetical protein
MKIFNNMFVLVLLLAFSVLVYETNSEKRTDMTSQYVLKTTGKSYTKIFSEKKIKECPGSHPCISYERPDNEESKNKDSQMIIHNKTGIMIIL